MSLPFTITFAVGIDMRGLSIQPLLTLLLIPKHIGGAD